jgi:hypothetical protein
MPGWHHCHVEESDSAFAPVALGLALAIGSTITTVFSVLTPWWVTGIVALASFVPSMIIAVKYGRRVLAVVEWLDNKIHRPTSKTMQGRPTVDQPRRSLIVTGAAIIFLAVGVVIGVGLEGLFTGSTSAAGAADAAATMPQGCTNGGPLVLAVSGRQDSPAPALTGSMHAAVVEAAHHGSPVGLVDVDGRPQLVNAPLPPESKLPNPEMQAAMEARFIASIAAAVSSIRAHSPHADVLDALAVAGHAVRAACDHGGTIYLEDSGLQEIGPLNFRKLSLLRAHPIAVAAFLAHEDELPNLKGETVVLVGIGDTAPPQGQLSISQQTNLIRIWSAIVKASGALVRVDLTPRGGPAPTHVPSVQLVPVA